jgi:hypothetical protein
MPLQVVGHRAEENVTSDLIIGLVVDGPYFELHGLETAERLFDQAHFLARIQSESFGIDSPK